MACLVPVIYPTQSRWAQYDPAEATADRHSVHDFDAQAARFSPHEFKDVHLTIWN